MAKTEPIAGHMINTKGHQVPVESIKPIDLERDAIVREIFGKASQLADLIDTFKHSAMGDIEAFITLSAEKYGAKLGGKIGNTTLTSFDGSIKIVRAIDERQAFDERLQAAKALIDECIHEWTSGSRPELRALINDAFQVDKQGKLNVNRILGLRRLDITDPRWQQAMAAIGDSLQVMDSKAYIRIYERRDDGSYEQMPLNVAV